MPIKSRLTTKGFEEYLEKIARAGRNVDAAADRALLAGGEILLDGMERRVPVGEAPHDPHPDNLKAHLELMGPVQEGNFHYIDVGLGKDTDADTARYGNVQEFGSATTPAQPYVRPTLDSDMGKARKAIKAELEESGTI